MNNNLQLSIVRLLNDVIPEFNENPSETDRALRLILCLKGVELVQAEYGCWSEQEYSKQAESWKKSIREIATSL